MRFRVRGIMKGSNIPVLHKIDGASNPYDAAEQAAKVFRSEGYDPSQIESLSVKPMKAAKAQASYFGKATTGRRGPIGRKVETAAKVGEPAAPAVPAAPAAPAAKPAPEKPKAK